MTEKPNRNSRLILASNSKFRAELLKNAGIDFISVSADIDERAIELPLHEAHLEAAEIAQVLAEAKAQKVSEKNSDALIIGCDQTLSLGGKMFHKPMNMNEARRHLLSFSGQTHQLNSGVALVFNEKTIWRYVSTANMTMRQLSPEFIGRYLAQTGESVLDSVGVYQIEADGVNLFEQIEGDYFTIIGMPLLPMLAELRTLDVIDG